MANQILLTDNLADEVVFNIINSAADNPPASPDNDPSIFNLTIEPTYYLNEFGIYDGFCLQPWLPISPGQYSADLYYSTENFEVDTLVDFNEDGNVNEPFVLTDELVQVSVFTLNNLTWADEDGDGDLEGTISDEDGNILNPTDANGNFIYLEAADVQYLIWSQIYDDLYAPDYAPGFDTTFYGPSAFVTEEEETGIDGLAAELNQALADAIIDTIPDNYAPDKAGDKVGLILIPDPVNEVQFILSTVELSGLGDFVWFDENLNGIQDENEVGVEGVTVQLLADLDNDGQIEIGEVLETTITDTNGFYSFDGIIADNYKVRFLKPDGTNFTTQNVGFDDTIDSDADSNGLTRLITLTPGEFNGNIDAGLLLEMPSEFAMLGDFVWEDLNANGIQDTNELDQGINGVEVKLLTAGEDGKFGTDDDVIEQTTFTANNNFDDPDSPFFGQAGYYKFNWLTPGIEYAVMFIKPHPTYIFSPFQVDNDPNSGINSDGPMSDPVVLTSGEFNRTIDAGLFRENFISVELIKFVRVDENPINIRKLVAVESINPPSGDLCDEFGDVEALTFQYLVGETVSTGQESDKARIKFSSGMIDDDGISYIIVTDEDDAGKALEGDGKFYFIGDVAFDEFFRANQNLDDFGSTTYIHFFDDSYGGLLQTIEYHTSCSQPIQLGDTIGNATLVGYDGEDGSTTISEPKFVDANEKTGPEAIVGSRVEYRIEVTNTNVAPISDVVVTDNNKTPDNPEDDFEPDAILDEDGFNVGDTNQDNQLDSDEKWLYTFSEDAEFGQQTNKATATGLTAGGLLTMATDPANYIGIQAPSIEGDVCDVLGKPVTITFLYDPSTNVATAQDSGKAEIIVNNRLDDDGVSYIIVTDEDDPTKALNGEGKRFFMGNVAFDKTFEANNNIDDFGSKIFIHFYDDYNGPLLQSITYHTSCSQPIQLGDVIGNATLVEYKGEDGSAALPPNPPMNGGGGDHNFPTIVNDQSAIDKPFNPHNIGVDANQPTGPIAQRDDRITFTYQVTNTGTIDLTITELFDDNDAQSGTFEPAPVLKKNGNNFGDDNNDGLVNPDEEWYFQAVEFKPRPGQNTNIAQVTAEDDSGTMVMDHDPGNYLVNPLVLKKLVAVEPMVEQGDVCETAGKPESLTFTYIPNLIIDTNQKPGQVEFKNNPMLDNDDEVFIETNKDFSGTVKIGEDFTVFATGGDLSFKIYDFQGGPLLQDIEKYHLSCSQDITLGDILGSVTLTGYTGENGSVSIPESEFLDANEAPGPDAVIGSQVEFRYEVSNVGTVALSDVMVTDDKVNPEAVIDENGFNIGDANNDNLLDVHEIWIYSASEVAEKGLQTNIGTALAKLDQTVLIDMDMGNYTGVNNPIPEGDVCDTFGKPLSLTFTNQPGTMVMTGGKGNNQDGKAKANGQVDLDGNSYFIVSETNNIGDIKDGSKNTYFAGNVAEGESFLASTDFTGVDKFESQTYILLFDEEQNFLNGNNPLQTIEYHTSCSQPIQINDVIGSVKLVEYSGESGSYDNPEIDPITGEIGSSLNLAAVFGKPQTLTFEYNNGDTLLTGGKNNNQDGKAKILVNKRIDDDGESYIIVTNEDKGKDALNGKGKRFFAGKVSFDDLFEASIDNAGTDKFDDKTYIHYFDTPKGGLLRSVQYQTKGDKEITLEDELSGATLFGYVGENGSTGLNSI